jgi:hypothetical protein
VLKDLPSKIERIEYCEMTPSQRELYIDRLESSKRTILTTSTANSPRVETPEPDAVLTDEEEVKPKKKSKKKAAPTKTVVPKIISDLKPDANTSNVLMDLRKAANHPLLFRRLYTDEKIAQMSQDCLKEFEFSHKDPKYILEDMGIMTDFELHRFVRPYPVGSHHPSQLRLMRLAASAKVGFGRLRMDERGQGEVAARESAQHARSRRSRPPLFPIHHGAGAPRNGPQRNGRPLPQADGPDQRCRTPRHGRRILRGSRHHSLSAFDPSRRPGFELGRRERRHHL